MAQMLSDFGHIIGLNGSSQVATMPTYTTVATGTIVQYVGSTDANYTNGCFYKCTVSGWEPVNVQGEDTAKADKVDSATSGNLASLDASGNLADSGWASNKTTTSATGNPISISGLKSNQLAINPVITLEPIQAGSGTPSPSNIRAISGYDKIEVLSCGKNIYDKNNSSQILNAYVDNIDNYCKDNTCRTIIIPCKYNTYYTVSKILSSRFTIGYTEIYPTVNYTPVYGQINDNSATSLTILTGASARYLVAYIYNTNYDSSLDNILNSLQVEENNQATTYEPYNPLTDIQLTLGQTIYGGTLDVEKGILVVDRGCKTFNGSEEGWIHSSSWTAPNVMANPNLLSDAVPVSGYWAEANITSNQGIVNMPGVMVTQNISGRIGQGDGTVLYVDLGVSQSDFVIYLTSHPLQIAYPLAEPFNIQLTPHEISLLKDYAYVSTNGTNIAFDYHNGEMASLADIEQLAEHVELLQSKLGYRDYAVKGSSTLTYGQLLAQIKPIYESLSENEKVFSKLIIGDNNPSSNECLSYCGAYWYSRTGLETNGNIFIVQVALDSCRYYNKRGDSFHDYTDSTTSMTITLRVFLGINNDA